MQNLDTLASHVRDTSHALAALAGSTADVVGASLFVVGERAGLMAAAVRTPWAADHAELGLMLPEKVTAFTAAGAALVEGWWTVQQEAGRHLMDGAVALAAFGCRPCPDTAAGLARRTGRWATASVGTTLATMQRALLPVHGCATANAHRLRAAAASQR
ncbi:MAG TPA: hypothetical protein VEB20_04915 [Azospirillaceae bacterium]|nr:hypothetical protein [Azospirillaceae bacterium]